MGLPFARFVYDGDLPVDAVLCFRTLEQGNLDCAFLFLHMYLLRAVAPKVSVHSLDSNRRLNNQLPFLSRSVSLAFDRTKHIQPEESVDLQVEL